jgi:hypothetical protein
VDVTPAALLIVIDPAPANEAGGLGRTPGEVRRESDQLRRMPVLPPASSMTTSAHGPRAGSPTRAPRGSSGWIGPVGTRFV